MPSPPVALLESVPPASSLVESELAALLGIAGVLLLSTFFSTLRFSLHRAHVTRMQLEFLPVGKRERVLRLLDKTDRLATSAGIFKITSDVVFVSLVLSEVAQDVSLEWIHLGLALGLAAPALLLITEEGAHAIARARGDELLRRVLPAFHLLQMPVAVLVVALDAMRKSFLRMLRIQDDSSARKIVAGLREVIEESVVSRDFGDTEREIIENVMEFGDVDAAEVMTPRTEIHAVAVDEGLEAAIRAFTDAGHSRIPVYDGTIDTIIGTISTLEVTEAMVEERVDATNLRDVMRPAYLVPETKLVSELLKEFRAQKQKMAIVLDEYGGTAGIVTLADVVAEIVGDIRDEYGEHEESMRILDGGEVEMTAALHVSEVNEALDLDIPEEADFETLGGFVLAELGHFPKEGESFTRDEVVFSIVEASDRRVLKVRVQRTA